MDMFLPSLLATARIPKDQNSVQRPGKTLHQLLRTMFAQESECPRELVARMASHCEPMSCRVHPSAFPTHGIPENEIPERKSLDPRLPSPSQSQCARVARADSRGNGLNLAFSR